MRLGLEEVKCYSKIFHCLWNIQRSHAECNPGPDICITPVSGLKAKIWNQYFATIYRLSEKVIERYNNVRLCSYVPWNERTIQIAARCVEDSNC